MPEPAVSTVSSSGNTWPLFLRYQAQAERHYRRGIEDLQRLTSMRDQLAVEQPVCEQLPADPDPLLTPHELSPVQFPVIKPPTEPNQPTPNPSRAISH